MPFPSLLKRLKKRKLVQWGVAYLAGAWVLYEVSDAVGGRWGLPDVLFQGLFVVLAFGFFITLVLAWYHGEKGRQKVSGPELLMVVALLIGAGVALSTLIGGEQDSEPSRAATADSAPDFRPHIAVLPFQSLSPEGPHSFFAGGLCQELQTQFTKVEGLVVIDDNSVTEYSLVTKSSGEIGDELGVGFVVDGSVQVLDDRLRVTVKLIDAETGEHRWGETYDETLDDAFKVQSEIAHAIVTEVGVELSEAEAYAIRTPPTGNAEAYQLFLQGEEYRMRPGYIRQNMEAAQRLYEQAIAQDSSFARAYASLSQVHGLQYWLSYDRSPTRLESMRSAVEMAARFSPDLPQTRWAMGMSYLRGDRDFRRALGEYEVAAEKLPGDGQLARHIGYAHRRLGNWDETLAAFEKARILDPRNGNLFEDLGGETYQCLHRYGDAIAAFDRALLLSPDFSIARLRRALVQVLWRGDLDGLRNLLRNGPEDFGPDGTRNHWRARLALWERHPDTILSLLGTPETVTFESQVRYEPGLLYAAWAHQMVGDEASATRAFSDAVAQLDSALRETPDDWRLHASRGLALAGLGNVPAADEEAGWLTGSVVYGDAFERPYLDEARAMIFAQSGLTEEALTVLGPLLTGPSWTSVPMVRLDPRFDPIRDDPRFQALLEEGSEQG